MNIRTDTTLLNAINTEKLTAYYELTKPGITFTVLASMLIGFILGSGSEISYMTMLHATIGTWLIASGTAAHNQFLEWRFDGKMKRTQQRPVPASKISPKQSVIFSLGLIFGGLIYLLAVVNFVAGIVSLLTTLIYLGIYTPMKRISVVNVFIGAIPGALPPVGGWAAATGHLGSTTMWILFTIVFLWQVPHVMAIAWVCKDDYSTAGFQMLPKNDGKGFKASAMILPCLIALLPVSAGLYLVGMNSWLYLVGAIASSLVFLYYGIHFVFKRNKSSAKKLMFASFGYLPAVWAFVIIDLLLL
ncbi:protoheme IX farnesyltransferase [Fodinibius salinus]|uniref:Protoheme IX farnesyltransferase n=1 Tax=Fodinibius salinus TaxID=860790 RepID=A0A5D3YG56_9BACT|nr:heme o synthase [Fodinibius salinus]TYP92663.1 protoheme IX farnesyltransferase [Fodinibius salinus]